MENNMVAKNKIVEARKQICDAGALLFQRELTDLAGGNISLRIDDSILITPSFSGTRKRWQLKPEDILVLDLKGNVVEGKGTISREAPTHLLLLNLFYPNGTAVIHAHARNVLVFCATQTPIPPVLEGTMKFGEIKVIQYANGGAQSTQLAENVAAGLRGQESRMREHAAAVLAPWHGIFVIGRDLDFTLDAVERIDVNARCILMGKLLLSGTDHLDKHRIALTEAIKRSSGGGE